MRKIFIYCLILFSIYTIQSCKSDGVENTSQSFYSGFQNPPAEARPFVRWWWNGNKINSDELSRELELLNKAGFGGVEINPIAMPKAPKNEIESLVWMSDEWIDMVVHAAKKAKDLGMITDIIAGTGWPFGGEFLQDHETSQRLVSDHIGFKGGETIELDETSLITLFQEKHKKSRLQRHVSKRTTYKLSYLRLVPEDCNDSEDVIDLLEVRAKKGKLKYKIDKPGNYILSYGLLQQNFRDVTLGAPGGAGPVMDHYKSEMTYAYLSRMKKISERSGIPLSDLIRALFCDSIEVSGANWTDGFSEIFFKTYGYKLDNWMPFVFYNANGNYGNARNYQKFNSEFKEQIKRVRYDYNKILVEVFLKNFTQVYKDFCAENNILCRYQAYGTPFLMGMLDGYMIPDIPESNNWIYSAEMKDSLWQWNQSHGYMTWNMYASAGANLSGKKITSCETMTNTRGVFKTTLEEIKQHDDMNFITGINHSILHGFNYSPVSESFPGWIRYGAYFSEQNTWWKHINHWVDYNARLSFVFQNSQADKSIAIIGPTSDIWGDEGLARGPFHLEPRYLYKLWEPISQLGYSAEYINQNILEGAQVENGKIGFGKMTYDLLVLASLKSLSPKAAKQIKSYVEAGGKVVVIDEIPLKSLHFLNYEKNDEIVKTTMKTAFENYSESFINLKRPKSLDELFSWTQNLLEKSKIKADIEINNPSRKVYQIHKYTDNKDIYFFTNVHRYDAATFEAIFPVEGKYPWIWNPETGERISYHFDSNANELSVTLEPLESLLLIFEDEKPKTKPKSVKKEIVDSKEIKGNWTIVGNRVDGKVFTWGVMDLVDFSKSTDTTKKTFGGDMIYKITIDNQGNYTHLDLGNVNEGITELYINGKMIGKRWYGKALFPIAKYLKEGENVIEIHYTTVLANYCKSLKNNPAAHEWTKRYRKLVSTGVEGPVRLLNYK